MVSILRAEHLAVCHTCRLRHPCPNWQAYLDFCQRHREHAVSYLQRDAIRAAGADRLAAWDPRRVVRSAFGAAAAVALRYSVGELALAESYRSNADIKQAVQTLQTMTVTNLHSLASSATAGWQSDNVDYSSSLYLDDQWQFFFDTANTAAANSKAFFCFAAHSLDGGTSYTTPATGTEGTITLVDVTANAIAIRLLGSVPYITTNENPRSPLFSMAATGNGALPDRASVAVINHSGAALSASGNTVKHRGVFATAV